MSKVLTGGRARLYVNEKLVGIFDSCTYGAAIGTEPIFILGSFGPKEIVANSYEPISVNCSGFRVVNQGAHVLPKFPKLADLLNLGPITISISDRQSAASAPPIMTVTGCVATSYNTGVNAKATSRLQVSYMGLKLVDESNPTDGEVGATDLP